MKNHPNGMQCLCAWVVKRKEETSAQRRGRERGELVERKEGDRFVLFFFLPTSIYDNERNEREEKEKNERKKEDASSIFLFGEGARAHTHTL
jgi:hypothetical protein